MNVRAKKVWRKFEEIIETHVTLEEIVVGAQVFECEIGPTQEQIEKARRNKRRIHNYRDKAECAYYRKMTKRFEAISYYERLYELTNDKQILITLKKLRNEKDPTRSSDQPNDEGAKLYL